MLEELPGRVGHVRGADIHGRFREVAHRLLEGHVGVLGVEQGQRLGSEIDAVHGHLGAESLSCSGCPIGSRRGRPIGGLTQRLRDADAGRWWGDATASDAGDIGDRSDPSSGPPAATGVDEHAWSHPFPNPRRIAVVILAAGLVGVVAVPQILATTAPPAPAAASAASLDAADRPARLGRVMRGDATVLRADGSKLTVHFERGQITAASATSLTLKGADGTTTTFAIGANTRIRSHGKAASAADLKVGNVAIAVGTASGSGYDALLVRVRMPVAPS